MAVDLVCRCGPYGTSVPRDGKWHHKDDCISNNFYGFFCNPRQWPDGSWTLELFALPEVVMASLIQAHTKAVFHASEGLDIPDMDGWRAKGYSTGSLRFPDEWAYQIFMESMKAGVTVIREREKMRLRQGEAGMN